MKNLAILGSTGSVGTQTVKVLLRNPGQYNVQLLAAKSNWRLMEEQVRALGPQWVVMSDPEAALALQQRVLDLPVKVFAGGQSLLELLDTGKLDLVVAAMVGHEGLLPVLTAIKAGSDIALANKEVLVMAGHLVTALCKEHGVKLLPVDSEHSAIFQCLEGHHSEDLRKIILTASGGPFRGKTREELEHVSPGEAVRHPNWRMGAKISVDSATLMNKGLEIIEAHWLFGLSLAEIEVLIHPQSIIHSLVEFRDGSILAQLGVASMELPIQYALSWPRRLPGAENHFLNWLDLQPLTFAEPDLAAFPCLQLARAALARGGNAPAVLSTANDRCVAEFLAGKLGFNDIPTVIDEVLKAVPWQADPDLAAILQTIDLVLNKTGEIIKVMG
jgi:1-deoxy-D-xylulose-5-phosphate reductoisomerase